jgi:hypothetical protein
MILMSDNAKDVVISDLGDIIESTPNLFDDEFCHPINYEMPHFHDELLMPITRDREVISLFITTKIDLMIHKLGQSIIAHSIQSASPIIGLSFLDS